MAMDSVSQLDALPPMQSPEQAWYGADMSSSNEWIFTLTDAHIAEIDAATQPLVERDAAIAQIVRSDFPLPTLGQELERLRYDIIEGRGFALIRGLPVDRYRIEEAATAYFGIGAWLGTRGLRTPKAMSSVTCGISVETP